MKSKDFINKLKWLVNDVPTVYYSGSEWSKWNGKSWNMDCVVSIKSILWGFSADKNKSRGGAVYKSNGVADFTCDGALNYCTDVSTDFSNLTPGEYLCMKGSTNHAGVYLGNGKVYECTSAWEKKCLISDIDSKGNRSYKGKKSSYKWTYHGKLKYIDYSDQIEPKLEPIAYKYKVGDVVEINCVYTSSSSDKKITPAITKGKITKIVNARNPYLLDDGNIGWINDDCVTVDCAHNVNTKPIEEHKAEKINPKNENINDNFVGNSQKPDLYYEKDNNNALLHLIDFIIELIKKIFKTKN